MMKRLIGLGAALVLIAGCKGSEFEEPSLDGGVSDLARDRLATARVLARRDVQWSTALGRAELVSDAGAFATPAFAQALGGVPMAFGARMSRFADGALEVRAGDAQLSLRVRDARAVEGALVDHDAVFADAAPSTDFLVGSAPGRIEAFWLLRDAAAPTRFVLSLALSGLSARVDGDRILFVDAQGAPRIRMPRPFARDANGVARAAAVLLDGETLTLTLDRTGLAFPILLDPAIEQVTWTDVGAQLPSWPPPGGTGYPRVTTVAGLQRVSASARAGNGRVYLFGGTTVSGSYNGGETPYVTQLLQWNGTAWSAAPNGNFTSNLLLGNPSVGTTQRIVDIAWDDTRKKLVMFGGASFGMNGPRMGVWEYDPLATTPAWSDRCFDSCYALAPPVNASPPFTTPSAVWAFGKIIMVHPSGSYEWDGTTLKKFGATPELKKNGVALAFDANRNKLVAYGDNSGASETWETDGATWDKVLDTGPLGVANASLAYHAGRKRVVLWASNASTGGLWSWTGATWSAITVDGAGPTARPNAAFTYDLASGKMLLQGGGTLGNGDIGSCYAPPEFLTDNNRDYRECARIDTWTSSLFGGACATTADCGGGTFCADGVCCKTACTGACRACDLVDSVGTCTVVKNAEDADTCSGASSCDASGACRKKQGQACTLGTECASGSCADARCCDTACGGACETCNLAGAAGTCTPLPKGSAGKGCSLYTCDGTSRTCATTCAVDGDCAPNTFCNAGACVAPRAKGGSCDRNRQCTTGVCADSVCCDSACGGACDVCSAALGATANGTCTVLAKSAAPAECGPARCSGTSGSCGAACVVDGDCSATGFCSGAVCVTVRKKGESCERTAQCATGLACADGVCCNEACDGACQACSALNKQSGDAGGECGPAKEGTNPRAKCVKSDVSSCGVSGFCGATGACAVYAAGTPCGPSGTTTCEGDTVKGQTCDGLGACFLDTVGTACSPGKCADGACKTTCASDADCATDGYCTAGSCKKKAAAGAPCAIDVQCSSAFCADGVCCNARCDRSCEACDQSGTAGTCTAITGKPRLGHPACAAGEPGNPCSAAACDGIVRASCAKKAGPEVTCRKGSCEGDFETLPGTCDGSGACPAAETRSCQPFACGAEACKKTCASDSDCKSGFVCNAATGACSAGDKCAGSTVTRVDGTVVECAPYVCESSGRCKTSCATTAECVTPTICNDGRCVDPVASAPGEESGGCTSSRRSAPAGAGLVLAAFVSWALARRRPSPSTDRAPARRA